ncbi:hypothetical protein [Streptomyces sp. NPDC001930]|uniref:hypothetical protein n=1 Tax=Streptomyces sp. NPDC001930 TaxID=3364625 RepID=UPI0036A660D2
MSREKAEAWARHWTESMARTAEADIVGESADASFHPCNGKNGETADDGRFTLMYDVRAKVPKERHASAVRAITDELRKQGFEIVGSLADPKAESGGYLVQAQHPKDRQFVSAGDVTDELITLTVDTPCLLPPGVEQQEF